MRGCLAAYQRFTDQRAADISRVARALPGRDRSESADRPIDPNPRGAMPPAPPPLHPGQHRRRHPAAAGGTDG